MRWRIASVVVLVAVGGGTAQSASAADVTFEEFINRVTVTAKPGEANRIRVTVTPSQVRITDPNAPVVDAMPTATCRAVPGGVTCDRVATETMRMQLGDRDDRLEFREAGDDLEQPLDFSARGGTGNDLLASITPTVARDLVLRGEAGNDQLLSGAGADLLEGGAGGDTLNGRGGRDRLNGGTGRDVFFGGTGIDRLLARDSTRDVRLDCGAGADSLSRDRIDPAPISC
jgi:RTX calcium-binding nonapeptide repeat (4 copies)